MFIFKNIVQYGFFGIYLYDLRKYFGGSDILDLSNLKCSPFDAFHASI